MGAVTIEPLSGYNFEVDVHYYSYEAKWDIYRNIEKGTFDTKWDWSVHSNDVVSNGKLLDCKGTANTLAEATELIESAVTRWIAESK